MALRAQRPSVFTLAVPPKIASHSENRDWFGAAFVEHFAASREWEEREHRRHISDGELARYAGII